MFTELQVCYSASSFSVKDNCPFQKQEEFDIMYLQYYSITCFWTCCEAGGVEVEHMEEQNFLIS